MTKLHKKIKRRKEFPHISRNISAFILSLCCKTGLWLGITALIIFNITALIVNPPPHSSGQNDVLMTPMSPDSHVDLAGAYWQNHRPGDATRELAIAEELLRPQSQKDNSDILGTKIDPLLREKSPRDLLDIWENEPNALTNEYVFWQSVVLEKPDYRDAYITLAALAYKLLRPNEATQYLHKALLLDPNAPLEGTLNTIRENEKN